MSKIPDASHGTQKFHGIGALSCLKAWNFSVPKIFVPGLSQRYLSESQASQGYVSRDSKSHGIPGTLPILVPAN